MPREDHIPFYGTVTDALGGGKYAVQIDDSNQVIKAGVCGRMKQNHIRVIPGDRVEVSVSPYDLTCGFITKRPRQ